MMAICKYMQTGIPFFKKISRLDPLSKAVLLNEAYRAFRIYGKTWSFKNTTAPFAANSGAGVHYRSRCRGYAAGFSRSVRG